MSKVCYVAKDDSYNYISHKCLIENSKKIIADSAVEEVDGLVVAIGINDGVIYKTAAYKDLYSECYGPSATRIFYEYFATNEATIEECAYSLYNLNFFNFDWF